MRLHHWLISLKHRRQTTASTRRRKLYRSFEKMEAAPSTEALETRLLLTTPPPVDPVEEAQNDADAAQQALDDANNTRDTEMAGIQSQFDSDSAGDTATFDATMQGIGATLDSDFAAGDATLEADTQTAQSNFDTALDSVGDTADAAWTPLTQISNLTCSLQTVPSIRTSRLQRLPSKPTWRRNKQIWTQPLRDTRQRTTRMWRQPALILTQTLPLRIPHLHRHQRLHGRLLTQTRRLSSRHTNRASPATTLCTTRMSPRTRQLWIPR